MRINTFARPLLLALGLGITAATARASGADPGQWLFKTLAGDMSQGSADGTGSVARFRSPSAIAPDRAGNFFVGDYFNCTIRRMTPSGVVTTVVGVPQVCGSADGTGSEARFTRPIHFVTDPAGNLYFAEYGNRRLRRLTPAGVMTTLRSDTSAELNLEINGIALASNGDLYVTEGHRILRITPAGAVTPFAGQTSAGLTDGVGTAARFDSPRSLAFDQSGTLFVADGNNTIRRVTPSALVTTFAGLASAIGSTDGTGSNARFSGPDGLAFDSAGNLWLADKNNHTIRRISPAAEVTTVAGLAGVIGAIDGQSTAARFNYPSVLSFDETGMAFVVDAGGNIIRRVTPAGMVSTVAGRAPNSNTSHTADGTGPGASFGRPRGLALEASTGNLFVVDSDTSRLRRITPGAVVTTVASDFSSPLGVSIDDGGTLYVADTGRHVINYLQPGGALTRLAGGLSNPGSRDGTGTDARFYQPGAIISALGGILYVADTQNCSIRRIVRRIGSDDVTTLAGFATSCTFNNGTGPVARFGEPRGVAVDASGVLFVADRFNRVIRRITPEGEVTTFAGQPGVASHLDGPAASAAFVCPSGIAVDGAGIIYVSDECNNTIRRIATDGMVTTIGGHPTASPGNEDGIGQDARFEAPTDLAVDAQGNLYISDNGRIRRAFNLTGAPVILSHPADLTVAIGQTTMFSLEAHATPAPAFRWQRSNDGGGSWSDLSEAAPYSGVASATLTITNPQASLNRTMFRAIATSGGAAATSVPATLTVLVDVLVFSPTSLRFAVTKAIGSATLSASTSPQVVVAGPASLAHAPLSASRNQPWISVAPNSTSTAFTVSIVNPGDTIGSATSLTGTVTITSSTGETGTLPVALTVHRPAATTPPFGQIDTPAQKATGLVGAVGITGWALDDIGVTSVKIYRNCLSYEPCEYLLGWAVVYIGDAAFVAGARPDVEAAFPGYPQTYRAGWGMQVLSNMLPHVEHAPKLQQRWGGQGGFQFFAFATDEEFNVVILGRSHTDSTPTSVTLNNDNLAKPFGTLDTPAQGGTVSGNLANFGWVLTPDSNAIADGTDILIPIDGSTMQVFIDGVAVGNVSYNQCRGNVGNPVPAGVYCNDDVANIFGQTPPRSPFTSRASNPTRYRNLDAARGAIGSFDINTLSLSNGIHSIAWGVTDSAGRSEGIGSRNFFVLNSGSDAADVSPDVARDFSRAEPESADARLKSRATSGEPRITARRGFDLAAPFVDIVADPAGERHVQIGQMDRLEIQLGAGMAGAYLVANGTRRDLAAGSHFDPATGTFTWAPAPGFLGTYRIVFVRSGMEAGSEDPASIRINVTIHPPRQTPVGESEIRMHLDAPTPDAVVARAFAIEGWSLDPQSFTGSGIGAIHVWARRLDQPTAGPEFVGAATLGVARADVAAAFGPGYHYAGYQLTATLAPGLYELTVYAWNHRTARWEDARSVRITVRP